MSEAMARTRAEIDRRVEAYGTVNLALVSLLNEAWSSCERGLFGDGKEQVDMVKSALQCAEIKLWEKLTPDGSNGTGQARRTIP